MSPKLAKLEFGSQVIEVLLELLLKSHCCAAILSSKWILTRIVGELPNITEVNS